MPRASNGSERILLHQLSESGFLPLSRGEQVHRTFPMGRWDLPLRQCFAFAMLSRQCITVTSVPPSSICILYQQSYPAQLRILRSQIIEIANMPGSQQDRRSVSDAALERFSEAGDHPPIRRMIEQKLKHREIQKPNLFFTKKPNTKAVTNNALQPRRDNNMRISKPASTPSKKSPSQRQTGKENVRPPDGAKGRKTYSTQLSGSLDDQFSVGPESGATRLREAATSAPELTSIPRQRDEQQDTGIDFQMFLSTRKEEVAKREEAVACREEAVAEREELRSREEAVAYREQAIKEREMDVETYERPLRKAMIREKRAKDDANRHAALARDKQEKQQRADSIQRARNKKGTAEMVPVEKGPRVQPLMAINGTNYFVRD